MALVATIDGRRWKIPVANHSELVYEMNQNKFISVSNDRKYPMSSVLFVDLAGTDNPPKGGLS